MNYPPVGLYGVDTSHWNGALDFTKIKATGKNFVIAKASDGLGNYDYEFDRSRIKVKQAGMIFGAYHYFEPEDSVDTQLTKFLQVAGHISGELPPTLDWEQPLPAGMGIGVYKQRALDFLQELASICKTLPILYCSQSWLHEFGDMTAFKKYPLWVARYNASVGDITPWDNYTFWQYAEQNGLDLDVFNGTLADLQKLAAS